MVGSEDSRGSISMSDLIEYEALLSYLTKVQESGIITTNQEVRYIFLSQTIFTERLIQIFRDLEAITIVKKKALGPNVANFSN